MPQTFKNTPSGDEIAKRATRGEDIFAHFTNKFTVVRPVRRVNVDFTEGMLRQLDQRAAAHLEEGRARNHQRRRKAD
jgi:hypothetical protein